MRTGIFLKVAIILMMLLIATTGCNGLNEMVGGKKVPLLFEADFEDSEIGGWKATDPTAWRIESGNNGKVLALHNQSDYEPQVR